MRGAGVYAAGMRYIDVRMEENPNRFKMPTKARNKVPRRDLPGGIAILVRFPQLKYQSSEIRSKEYIKVHIMYETKVRSISDQRVVVG